MTYNQTGAKVYEPEILTFSSLHSKFEEAVKSGQEVRAAIRERLRKLTPAAHEIEQVKVLQASMEADEFEYLIELTDKEAWSLIDLKSNEPGKRLVAEVQNDFPVTGDAVVQAFLSKMKDRIDRIQELIGSCKLLLGIGLFQDIGVVARPCN